MAIVWKSKDVNEIALFVLASVYVVAFNPIAKMTGNVWTKLFFR